MSMFRCRACKCRLDSIRPRGRPRLYCSNACRQFAYRQRLFAKLSLQRKRIKLDSYAQVTPPDAHFQKKA